MRTTQVIDIKAADILTLHKYLIDKRIIVDRLFDEIKERAKQFSADINLNLNEVAMLNALSLRIETIQKTINASQRLPQDPDLKDKTFTDLPQLPNEILLHIFSFLSFQDRLQLFTVSKQAMAIALKTEIASQYIYCPKLNLILKARPTNIPSITLAQALKLKSKIYRESDNLINEIESLENKTEYRFHFFLTTNSPGYAKNIVYIACAFLVISALLSATLIANATYVYSLPSKKYSSANINAPSILGIGIGLLALTILIGTGMKPLIKQIENCKNRPLHKIRNNLTFFIHTEASDNSHSINEQELQQVVIHR